MRPFTDSAASGDPDPSREVAAEILRRHLKDERPSRDFLRVLFHKLRRGAPPSPEPPGWPLAGVRQPPGRGPRPRSGAVAVKEPQ